MRAIAIAGLVAAACSAPAPRAPAHDLEPSRTQTIERAFTLAWRGARIGDAREREAWDAGGVTVERRERIRVRRGGVVTAIDAAIAIHADRALVADRVTWRETRSDVPARTGRATRDRDGWRIELDGEPARRAPGDAVPEELETLLVRRDGGFRGELLLTGRGFARARGEITRTGATIVTDGGTLTAAITLDRDGDPLRVVASDGVVEARASEAELAAAFDPPEVVDGAAIALDREVPAAGPITIVLRGVTRAPPPALPGQRVVADGDAWRVTLEAAPTRDASLAPLAHAIFAADDGDCTAHALAFAARAPVPTRVVTGWRVDGARLIRHRWALAQVGGAWIAIDPSYDEAPASPRLIGLAVTDATAAGLATGDLAFAGTDAATATLGD